MNYVIAANAVVLFSLYFVMCLFICLFFVITFRLKCKFE